MLRDDEKYIFGQLHYRTPSGTWRAYTGVALEERMRQLEDNPAPCFAGDDSDK